MYINTQENEMIEDAIDYPAVPAFLIQQTGQLSIGVVEQVRQNVEEHADNIRRQIAIEIQVTGKNSADPANYRHRYRG